MKILIVNTYDRGGAANACLRLHEGLLNEGIDSKVLLKHKRKQIPFTYQFIQTNKSKKIYRKFFNLLRRLKLIKEASISPEKDFLNNRLKDLELFSFPQSNFDITESTLYKDADIINLHWTADFLDYESFFKVNTKPVVWTLHDMNPFTGGEHYEGCYLGMDDFGFPIKRKVPENEKQFSKENLFLKIRLLKAVNNLTVVAPSKWLAESAMKSLVFKSKPVHCIPYGVNTTLFQEHNSVLSKTQFNIPIDKKMVLFVADSITNQRKGFEYLKKAFEKLKRPDVVLCSIGNNEFDFNNIENVIELGVIKSEKLMSMAYSAADVFVIPSLMDNLPNTVLESLLCGTPVIGFPVGGISDMIEHGQNGILTTEISVDALLRSLQLFLDSVDSFNKEIIREQAIKKYDLNIQAREYKALFEKILDKA